MNNKERGSYSASEYEARVKILESRIERIDAANSNSILFSNYYLGIVSNNKDGILEKLRKLSNILNNKGIYSHILNNKELISFIRFQFDDSFDTRTVNEEEFKNIIVLENIKFNLMSTNINNQNISNYMIKELPLRVSNGWAERLFDIPKTRVVMRFKPIEKHKAIRRIDTSIMELRSKANKNKMSESIDMEEHLASLEILAKDLHDSSELLFDTSIYVSAYDEINKNTNKKVPYSTDDQVDNPVSLYAATKKSDELIAHAYAKLYNIPSTGLRFFTVYGPAGRPDMAYFGFTNKFVQDKPVEIFNFGKCKRDFTYIDDIVEGIIRVMQKAPEKKNGEDGLPIPPYKIYNIGNSHPEDLLEFVQILAEELIKAEVLPPDFDLKKHMHLVPMQPGDVPITYADTKPLEDDFGFKPSTSLRDGLRKFAQWYKAFYSK